MNSLVSKYRELFPDDARSDSAILLDLGDKYPDKISLFPDAKADYDALAQERTDALAPTFGEKLKNAGGSVVRGAVSTLASIPKSIATGGAALEQALPILGKINVNPDEAGLPPEERSLYLLGEKVEDKAPEVEPGMEKNFLFTKVPEGIGSTAAFAVGGAAGKVAKVPELLSVAGLGAMTQAQQGFEDAKSKGATDEQAYKSFLLNAGVGTSEALPISRMLKHLDGWSGGTLKKALIESTKEGLEEAIQEAFQSAAGDAIAKHIVKYDPNRKMFDDLLSDAGTGLVSGFIVSALTHAIGHKVAADSEHMAKGSTPPENKQAGSEVPEFNPADSYQLQPEIKQKITRVIGQELSGDQSLAMQSALASIYSDPDQHAYYATEKARMAREAGVAKDYADDLDRQAQAAEARRLEEQSQSKSRADLEEETGRALQLASEQRLADEEARQRASELYDQQQAGGGTQEATVAENAPGAVPAPEAVPAAPSAGAIAKARAAAADVAAQGPRVMPWEMTQAQAVRAYPTVPVDVAKRAHRPWIDQVGSEQGPAFDIEDVDFGDTGTQVGESSRGSSKETLPAWYSVADGSEAGDKLGGLVSKFSTDLGEVLTRQASKDSKVSKNWTHRLTAFAAPDGSVALLGTFKRAGKEGGYFVADPSAPGTKSMALKKLMDAGYKPFASIRTKTAFNNPAYVMSRTQFDAIAHQVESAKQETERAGAAVEEQLSGVTQPEGLAAVGRETIKVEPKLEKLRAEPLFSATEAARLFDAIAKAADGSNINQVVASLVSERSLTENAFRRAAARLVANKAITNQLTLEEARVVVGRYLADQIESAYARQGSREGFARELSNAPGVQAGRGETGGAGSGSVGPGGEAHTEEAAQGTKARVEAAAGVTDANPTEAQKAAGNYRKGHVDIDGLDITIETPKGATRSGVGSDGKPWTVTMPAHYGYVRGTEAIDGDHVDVYIGDNPDSKKVWVVDQIDPKTRRFDEHKALLGFNSRDEAMSAYIRAFSDGTGPSRIGEMTQMTMDDFRDWVHEGDTKKPLSYGKQFKPSLRYRTQQESENRATSAEIVDKFYAALDGLAANGIDVDLITRRLGQLVVQFGKYDNAIDAITLSLADVHNPTVENMVYLFHEAAHAVFARMKPADQVAITEAIRKLTNGQLGIEGVQLSANTQEERLAEAAAQELVKRGFDPEKARATWAKVMRFIKEMYYRATLWVQQARFGRDNTDPGLARAYFQNRLEAMLAGKSSMSFLNFIGGRAPTTGEHAGMFESPSVLPERFDPETGQMVYADVDVDSAAAARFKYRTPSFVTDPVTPISKDVNQEHLSSRDVAAQNEVERVMRMVYDNWTSAGHNPSGLSFGDFVNSGNFLEIETMPADVIRTINEGLTMASKPTVTPTTSVADLLSDSMKQRAAAVAHRELERMRSQMAERRSEAEWNLSPKNSKNAIDRLQRLNQRVNDLRTKYTDADLVLSDARDRANELFDEFREDVKEIKNEARRVGVLSQVIQSLGTRMDRPALKQYEGAINRLFGAWSGDRTARFKALLDHVANLPGINWETDSARDIRRALELIAPGDAVLEPLVTADVDSRTLFSVVVAFGRSNSMVMDLLQLRRTQAIEERTKVNQALAMALSEARDGLKEARQIVRSLPRLGAIADRLLKRIEEHKAEARDLHDEVQRDRMFIDFHHDNGPVWRQEMAKLERTIGAVSGDWEPTHGAEYLLPASATATIDQVEASKKKFDLSPANVGSQLRIDLGKMKAWLNAVPDAERGATWGLVKQQYDKLSLVDARFNHDAIKPSLINRLVGSMTDRLDYVGTPAAKQVATRLRRMTAMMQSFTRESEGLGFRWSAAYGEAVRATGLSEDAFKSMFYDRSLKFIENRQDILAKHKDLGAAQTEVLRELKSYLERDPDTAGVMRDHKVWVSLERLLRTTGEASSHLDGVRKEMGIKLLDASEGYRMFRDSIRASLFTVMRGFSKSIERTYNAMLPKWGGSATPKLTKAGLITEYNTDRNAMVARMAGLFDADTIQNFARPLVMRTGRSVFYAPPLPGGIQNMAMRERVIKAFEKSRGNMVMFAEELYRNHAGTTDMGEYVGEVLSTFQSFFNQVQSVMADHKQALDAGMPVPPRVLMDARKSEEFPGEWLDYKTYDPHDMKNNVKLLSYEAGFGSDMRAIRKDFETAHTELKKLADRFDALTQQALATTGGKTNRAFKEELKRLAGSAEEVSRLRAAERNARTVREMNDQFSKMLKTQSGVPIEFRAWMEVLQTLTAMTVQGPGTALTDTVSAFEQPIRKMGVNSITGRQMLRTGRSITTEALGTFLQAFGHQVGINAENVKRRVEMGYRDTDATLKLKDKLRASLRMPTTAQSAVGRGAVATARAIRTVLGSGIGTGKGEAQYATLKPHAAFTQVAQWTHGAVIDGLWGTFEDLASRAVNHFESAAGAADMADPAFRFDAKTLGYGKGFMGLFDTSRAFDYLVETLQRFGFSLEELSREAVIKRRTDPTAPLLTHHQYQVLAALGQNEVTLESNITNRPPGFMTNPVLYAASPLVGWTVSKANEVAKGFRHPNGTLAWNSVKLGLAAYAGILPLAMAYAWLREDWDEEVQGKKTNVMGYGEENNFLALLDKLGRVGTFGVFGDALNSMLNQDTNRPFSVDQRVFFVSSALQGMQSLGTWWRQGEYTYGTVGRQLVNALGGSGYLQYADALNNALGLDNAEARVVKRVNVSNYLRAAGRDLNMDVRTSRGGGGSDELPNPIKPWVSEMYLSALANDAGAFQRAYRQAINASRDQGKDDPEGYVKRSFQGYNPLRTVFRTEPSEGDYRKVLGRMDEQGRTTVQTAIRLFNGYAGQLGIKEDYGRKERMARASAPVSLDEIRQRAVGL